MGFDPCNCFLQIQESNGIPTPKMRAHLGMRVFILTLHTPSWPTPLQAFALVLSPRPGLRHYVNNCCKNNCDITKNGENTLWGGHFGHFHDTYVKYISTKHITFNFEFHFWCLGLIFSFSQI
jgi:hypothetical protein